MGSLQDVDKRYQQGIAAKYGAIRHCCQIVLDFAPDLSAKRSARECISATHKQDMKECRIQAGFILNSITSWRGENANKVRKFLTGIAQRQEYVVRSMSMDLKPPFDVYKQRVNGRN